MVTRAYYHDEIEAFLLRSENELVGILAKESQFPVEKSQLDAWVEQARILRPVLTPYSGQGKVYFEYSVPRMGRRIDVVALIRNVVFVIEFKVGESAFLASAIDQVCDYALDLKNFHETTHGCTVAPILVATKARSKPLSIAHTAQGDGVLVPVAVAVEELGKAIAMVLASSKSPIIDAEHWEQGHYRPTPTIIEAALALFAGHSVDEISRSDAGAKNIARTSRAITAIVQSAQSGVGHKAICFVTGVPGAGKTLVGLNTAAAHTNKDDRLHSVFLSGNGPLVAILREALARDRVRRERERGRPITKKSLGKEIRALIQNVHNFRNEYVEDPDPPNDHVVIFDEAQRAWNLSQTERFMRRRRDAPIHDFGQSEPEFLISCMDRRKDWAVIVCLVGGGQEINTGEAGISEWIRALSSRFRDWHVHISPHLTDSEYGAQAAIAALKAGGRVHPDQDLHLSVSMRSFRAENVSAFVKAVLDHERERAQTLFASLNRYPIVLTRDLGRAKQWVKRQARGSERFGTVVSSKAQRLKPYAIDVRPKIDPVHWFLHGKNDVRSSYYLEDVATEFDVQGLELDWTCVVWDGDFRAVPDGWEHFEFKGKRWQTIEKADRRSFQKNAYRVLLTRARQGMVVVVPEGDPNDHTRAESYYDPTYEYLRSIGIPELI